MLTAVITGANSGIGHEWAKILIKEGYNVHALDVSRTGPITSLSSPTCTIHAVDVSSPSSIASFASTLSQTPVHLLLNVAGVLPHEDTLETVSAASLSQTFAVNASGPLLLTQALLPNLLLATKDASPDPVRIALVSSRVGSMSDNASGGSYAYRSSKAALNAVGKSLSVDLRHRGIVVALLHPGIVRTNLTRKISSKEDWDRAAVPVVAAEGLWKVLRERYNGVEDSGRFLHREGWEIGW